MEPREAAVPRIHLFNRHARMAGAEEVNEPVFQDGVGADARRLGNRVGLHVGDAIDHASHFRDICQVSGLLGSRLAAHSSSSADLRCMAQVAAPTAPACPPSGLLSTATPPRAGENTMVRLSI